MSNLTAYSIEALNDFEGMYAGFKINGQYNVIAVNDASQPVGYTNLGPAIPSALLVNDEDFESVSSLSDAVNIAVEGHKATLEAIAAGDQFESEDLVARARHSSCGWFCSTSDTCKRGTGCSKCARLKQTGTSHCVKSGCVIC